MQKLFNFMKGGHKTTDIKETEYDDLNEYNELLEKPVIAFLNEYRDPIIGFYLGVENGEHVIDDYVTDEKVRARYIRIFEFTEQRYQAALRFDPFELGSFLFPEDNNSLDIKLPKEIWLKKPYQINELLRRNGYWRDLAEYQVTTKEDIFEETSLG